MFKLQTEPTWRTLDFIFWRTCWQQIKFWGLVSSSISDPYIVRDRVMFTWTNKVIFYETCLEMIVNKHKLSWIISFKFYINLSCNWQDIHEHFPSVDFAEEFPPQVVPGGHRGVSQEQILLSFWGVLRREGWRSLRRSPDMSRSVSSCFTNFVLESFESLFLKTSAKLCQSSENIQ